jgi:hypothetical protein
MALSAKLRKVSDRLYREDWSDGKAPVSWRKGPEVLGIALSDARLVTGIALDEESGQSGWKSYRSIIGTGRIDQPRTIRLLGQTDDMVFETAEVSIRPVPFTAKIDQFGYLMHAQGVLPHRGWKRTPHLTLELFVPNDLFDLAWLEIESSGVEKLELLLVVDAFRSEGDQSSAEPWAPQCYAIETGSSNSAEFRSLSVIRQPLVSPDPVPKSAVREREAAEGLGQPLADAIWSAAMTLGTFVVAAAVLVVLGLRL